MSGVSDTNITVIQAVVLPTTTETRERASACELETLTDRATQTGTIIAEIRHPDTLPLHMETDAVMTLAAITGSLQEASPGPQRRITERAILSLSSQSLALRWLQRPSVCPRPKTTWRWMRSSLMS